MSELVELASGLQFPEGPVAMADGSFLVVEIKRGTLSRVLPGGEVAVVADLGGGPNGVAIGPDGAAYVCNNGGFLWTERSGFLIPLDLETGSNQPPDYAGGRIERVDLATGEATVLYTECGGHPLRGPNDIVFDQTGHFWFTDLGKGREREVDRGGLYYAAPDGSSVVEVAYGIHGANGVGLSPSGDRVYVAETYTGRLLAWELEGPGRVRGGGGGVLHNAQCLVTTPGHLDSLAVEQDGTVVVAALAHGLCVVPTPTGEGNASHHFVAMPDPLTTNVCFTGPDRRTAVVTLSGTGRLVALEWPRPGLDPAFAA
ncbi:MAG: SMP-30/gluconolactonase/LRE family protein [Acidimicrobiales bacterium]